MGKKIFAATVFLVIAIMTAGYLWLFQEKYRLKLEETARVQETLSLVYDAQSNLSDAEAITRGYILTGDEEPLEIFQKALRELHQSLDRLNRMTANEPEPQRLLGELNILIGRRQALLQVAIDLRRLKGSESPEHVILAREGTKVQNEIRRTFDQLEDYGKKMLHPDWRKERGRVEGWVLALNLATLGSLSLLLLSLYFLHRENNQRQKAEEKLVGYQEDLRSCTSQLSLAEERERRRIAAHLHDQIGQTLTFATIRLRELQKSTPGLPPDSLMAELDGIGGLMEQAIRETRSLTFQISSPILYEMGLEAAIESLTEEIPGQHGISASFETDSRPKPLDEELRILLFQAVRELLVNVVKHARAQRVEVSIRRDGGHLRLRVADDGAGFTVSETGPRRQKYGGFGLFSISERLRLVGGRLQVDSEPGAGTRINISVPLKEDA